jgi:hypothetical protein
MQRGLVGKYLVHSYLYYVMDSPLISDVEYDQLCKDLLSRLGEIGDHPHKHLISKEALEAGSGYHLKREDYPTIVAQLCRCALQWKRLNKDYFEFLEGVDETKL